MKTALSRSISGFTLVELSIVLVIIGLLTGGVLSGQSLIHAAELKALTTEYTRYFTAAQAFRDKYQAVPGDMRNATAFWGYAGGTSCTNSSGTTVTTPGTCDGDGSGTTIYNATAASSSSENLQFWRQLALAGLIEGSYTGTTGIGGVVDFGSGTNLPKSKYPNSVWWVNYQAPGFGGDPWAPAGEYGNYFTIGALSAASWPNTALLKPEDAWNIDTKLDDGLPARGKVLARYWNNACSNAASQTDLTGTYRLTDTSAQCILYFTKAF